MTKHCVALKAVMSDAIDRYFPARNGRDGERVRGRRCVGLDGVLGGVRVDAEGYAVHVAVIALDVNSKVLLRGSDQRLEKSGK